MIFNGKQGKDVLAMTYKVSETALAARRQQELLNGNKPPEIDAEHACRVANAMQDYRAENLNEPLARLWHRLAVVALQTK